jgi:WD40 repeat protein
MLAYKRFSHFVRDGLVLIALLVFWAITDARRHLRERTVEPAPPLYALGGTPHADSYEAATFSADGGRCALVGTPGYVEPPGPGAAWAPGTVIPHDVANDRWFNPVSFGPRPSDASPDVDSLVRSIALSPDGTTLAFGGDGAITLWDVDRHRIVEKLDCPRTKVACLAFAPDGRAVAAGAEDGDVEVTGLDGPRRWHERTDGGAVRCLAFDPDGRRLAVGTSLGGVLLFDAGSGTFLHSLKDEGPQAHRTQVVALAFRTDGRGLATASRMDVKAWDADTGQKVAALPNTDPWGRGWPDVSLAYSPDGRALAIGLGSTYAPKRGEVRLWRPGEEAGSQPLFVDDAHFVLGLAFSPEGQTLATAGRDGNVRRWDVGGR